VPRVLRISRTYYLSIPSELVKEMDIQEGDIFSVEKFEEGLLYKRIVKRSGSIWI